MGWTITPGAKRRDVIEERTTDYEDNLQRRVCLARAVRGKVLWTVWEITTKRDGRTLALHRLRHPRDGRRR